MPHGESDDSSVDEQYEDDHGASSKGNKPWVPAIEDPNYFEDLSPEEIYDSFFSIRRMGFIANRIIRKLNETKHIVSSKILEKRKKLKAVQRKQFEQLSPAGVEYLKVLLKMEIAALKNSAQNVEAGLNPSPSVKARLAHLADDHAACEILGKIYATDSSIRTLELWKTLAQEYVNNHLWQPKRGFIDERVVDIDPSRVPEEKFTPESLRSVFSRLRIEFTKTVLKFQTAIKTANSREALDTEFWERYARHDKAIYYIYQLFHDRSNQDCLMIDSALSRTDIDMELAATALGYQSNHRKRDREAAIAADDALGDEPMEFIDGNESSAVKRARGDDFSGSPDEIAWQASVKKDRAIANYYKRLCINNDIKFYQELLSKENVGEAMKRNVKAKVNMLLIKKVEDRYDDLTF